MSENPEIQENGSEPSGCIQAGVICALIGWLAIVPPIVALVVALVAGPAAASVTAAAAILGTAILLLPIFVGAALLTRGRAGWKPTTATAAGLTGLAGFIVLEALVRALFPETPGLLGEGAWAGVLRLGLLLPYTLLAAALMPRLAGVPRRPLEAWLGVDAFKIKTLLVALAVAALLTLAWPLTGSLGDSLTSLSILFQVMTHLTPQVLLVWGLVFALLTSTYEYPWTAALATLAIYFAACLAGVLPDGDWAALTNVAYLVPMGFLLTELRARRGGMAPLLTVAGIYVLAPLLAVDPRYQIIQGIPETQHAISRVISISTASLVGLGLWGGRRLLDMLADDVQLPAWAGLAAAALAAAVLVLTWAGLYVLAGEPGFANDGLLIILEEQAELSGAEDIADRDERLTFVRDELIATAERTQAPLRAQLDERGIPYQPFYVTNMIRVDGHRWMARRFANQPGVAEVIVNPNVRRYPTSMPLPYGEGSPPTGRVLFNLKAIGADEAWAQDVTGEGIVVAGQDTGYDWTHPVLRPHYRGWDGSRADHDGSWHDAWDDTQEPHDDDSHGTHTMGTVLGDDGGNIRTGVAPGAQWIGCRNMRRGFGNPGAYIECMEFFLAPYPLGGDAFAEGDVSLAPHVINNSWGCPDEEGCFDGTLEPATEALRAAGIMMVVSAGNDGPACETALEPPARYDAVFSVGATTNGGSIVGFSSRGPVDGLVKPDISAPGESLVSSTPGGSYGYAGGTSMAGPHVAGTVALLWSANPALIGDIDATEALLCRTAQPKPVQNACTFADEVPEGMFSAVFYNPVCACGDVTGTPNNVYGCGLLDAGAAVEEALGGE